MHTPSRKTKRALLPDKPQGGAFSLKRSYDFSKAYSPTADEVFSQKQKNEQTFFNFLLEKI